MKAAIKILTVSLVLAPTLSAWALNFKTNLQQVSLPSTSPRKIGVMTRAPSPGSMSISGQVFCGDGDVVHYVEEAKAAGASFDVVDTATDAITYTTEPDGTIKWSKKPVGTGVEPVVTTIGYWVVEDGQDPLPTKDNFNTVAWGHIPTSADGSVTMATAFPANQSMDNNPAALDMLRKHVLKAKTLEDKAFGIQKNYRMYMGVFGCLNPLNAAGSEEDPEPGSNFRPSSVELGFSFANASTSAVLQEFEGANWSSPSATNSFLDSHQKIDLDKHKDMSFIVKDENSNTPQVTFKVDNSGQAQIPSDIVNRVKSMVSINYPNFPAYEKYLQDTKDAQKAKYDTQASLSKERENLSKLRDDENAAKQELKNKIAALEAAELALKNAAEADKASKQLAVDEASKAKKSAEDKANDASDKANKLASHISKDLEPAAKAASDLYADLSSPQRAAAEMAARNKVYTDHMKAAMQSVLPSSVLNASDSSSMLSACQNQFNLKTSSSSKVYRWEDYPLNLSCKALYGEGGDTLKMAYSNLAETFVPAAGFGEAKKAVARFIYMAGALEGAQNFAQGASDYTAPNPHCFLASSSRSYIDKLMVSYPIKLNYDSSTKKYKLDNSPQHMHPEPLFALRNGLQQYAKNAYTHTYNDDYTMTTTGPTYNPRADLNSVFCQIYGDACTDTMVDEWKQFGILLPVNQPNRMDHKIDGATFSVPLTINFKIRSLSEGSYTCNGTWFC